LHVEEVAEATLRADADVAGAAVHAEDLRNLLTLQRREGVVVIGSLRCARFGGVRGLRNGGAGAVDVISTGCFDFGRGRGRGRRVDFPVKAAGTGVNLSKGAGHGQGGSADAEADCSKLATNSRRAFRRQSLFHHRFLTHCGYDC
jgi:hypothetical protein